VTQVDRVGQPDNTRILVTTAVAGLVAGLGVGVLGVAAGTVSRGRAGDDRLAASLTLVVGALLVTTIAAGLAALVLRARSHPRWLRTAVSFPLPAAVLISAGAVALLYGGALDASVLAVAAIVLLFGPLLLAATLRVRAPVTRRIWSVHLMAAGIWVLAVVTPAYWLIRLAG
jgi:hypothetical protein